MTEADLVCCRLASQRPLLFESNFALSVLASDGVTDLARRIDAAWVLSEALAVFIRSTRGVLAATKVGNPLAG